MTMLKALINTQFQGNVGKYNNRFQKCCEALQCNITAMLGSIKTQHEGNIVKH